MGKLHVQGVGRGCEEETFVDVLKPGCQRTGHVA